MIDIAINLLTFIFVLVCALMIFVILMQRSKQEGLGTTFGQGATSQYLGTDTVNVLVKTTVVLCALFYILSISLAYLYSIKSKGGGGSLNRLVAAGSTNLPSVATLPSNPLNTNTAPVVPGPTPSDPSAPLIPPVPEVTVPSTNVAPATVPVAPATNATPVETPAPAPAPASTPAPAPAPAVTPEPAAAPAPAAAPVAVVPAPAATNLPVETPAPASTNTAPVTP